MKVNGDYRGSWMPACSTMMPVVLMCGPAESGCHGGGGEKTSPIGFSHGPREAAIVPSVTGRSSSKRGNEQINGKSNPKPKPKARESESHEKDRGVGGVGLKRIVVLSQNN